jgi:hypothetical protein
MPFVSTVQGSTVKGVIAAGAAGAEGAGMFSADVGNVEGGGAGGGPAFWGEVHPAIANTSRNDFFTRGRAGIDHKVARFVHYTFDDVL